MALRIDRQSQPSFITTPDGYLRGAAIVTRTGVFEYMEPNGTIRKELRHPDDVYAQESLASLVMIPVTLEHPAQLVTSASAHELAVGQTGENIKIDSKHVVVPFTVTHQRGIDAINAGKRQLSLGYECELEESSGEYNGQEYTHRQTNIRYNHLAIVDRARAGAMASINLDGFAVEITEKEKTMAQTLKADSQEEMVAEVLPEATNSELTELMQQNAQLQQEVAQLQAKVEELQASLEEKMAAESSEAVREDHLVKQLIKNRLGLERQALRLDSSIDAENLSDSELMIRAIRTVRENFDADNKSEEYLRAAFDMAVEMGTKDNCLARARKQTTSKSDGVKNVQLDALTEIKNMWRN